MSKKFVCPDCGKQEVEEMNACGASNYFCDSCKKLISSSRIDKTKNVQENRDRA